MEYFAQNKRFREGFKEYLVGIWVEVSWNSSPRTKYMYIGGLNVGTVHFE